MNEHDMGHNETSVNPTKQALFITLFYLVSGLLWILTTDWLLARFDLTGADESMLQTLKGSLYVLFTSLLVYWLARRGFQNFQKNITIDYLKESEIILKKMLSNLGDAVFIIDPKDRLIRTCNNAAEQIFGYPKNQLIGQSTQILHIDAEAFRQFGEITEPILDELGIFRGRYQMKHRDGTIIDTENAVITLHDNRGWQFGVVSIVRDISARVQAQAAVELSEKVYRLLAENSLDVIWKMNMNFQFTYVNSAIESHTGYTPEEFIGTTLENYLSRSAYERVQEIIEHNVQKGSSEQGMVLETKIIRKDQSLIDVEIHGKVIFDQSGNPVEIQGIARDISERLKFEAHLRQSQKMETIGTLASGIAHEINTPITAIQLYAQMIQHRSNESEKIFQHAHIIERETHKLHNIVRELLGYAHEDSVKEKPKLVRMGEVINNALTLVQGTLRDESIHLEVLVDETVPPAVCYSYQIQQVLLNLISNARDSLNEKYPGGDPDKKIIISVTLVEESGQEWVRTTVEDLGTGIPEDVQERMFEPFFTTKPRSEGTGLGLWIIFDIIKGNDGKLEVETEVDAFTRFHFDLPVEKVRANMV